MIDWKRKLTSRKLWTAICSLVANLVIAFGGNEQASVQITAIIMGVVFLLTLRLQDRKIKQ